MNPYKIAMLLFVLSESIFFIFLIAAFLSFHGDSSFRLMARHFLDAKRTGLFTAGLLLSSWTVLRAEVCARKGNWKRFQLWLSVTIILGVIFLYGQGSEYLSLIQKNVTVAQNIFGTTFFTLTGFHGLHVGVGILLLSMVLGFSLTKKGTSHTLTETISLYWHFVDAVWVFVFAIIYLWTAQGAGI
jgi:heme/copper-type cytochrome/quinol oxidase subunit 3